MARNGVVLAIGMADSVHFARWVADISPAATTLIILPSSPHRHVHPVLRQILSTRKNTSLVFSSPFLSVTLFLLDRLLLDICKAIVIAYLSLRHSPQIIYAHQFQYSGYSLGLARFLFGLRGRLLVICNWGSELSFFSSKPTHRFRLKAALQRFDFFHAECGRDLALARRLGFNGKFLETQPISGGFSTFSDRPDNRTYVAVKGYLGRWGRAQSAIEIAARAINQTGSDAQIVVFSASPLTKFIGRKLVARHRVTAHFHSKGSLNSEEMLRLFGASLAYVSVSKADGIGTTAIEAASQGAFPFQLDTSCLGEWLDLERGYGAVCSSKGKLEGELTRLLGARQIDQEKSRMELVAEARSKFDKSRLTNARRSEFDKLLKS